MQRENFMDDKKYKPSSGTEKCIICGENTEIPVGMKVQERRYYVRGCGPLCEKCYKGLYSEWKKFRVLDKKEH